MGEVFGSTFDENAESQCRVGELALERAKRLVEAGRDVIILLDSITRFTRAYNLAAPTTAAHSFRWHRPRRALSRQAFLRRRP